MLRTASLCKNCGKVILDNEQYKEDKDGITCLECYTQNFYKNVAPAEGTSLAAIHYQKANIQPIEIMQMHLHSEQFIGFLRGNVIKYSLRMGLKDSEVSNAEKACQYAKWLVQALKGETIKPMEG